VTLQMVKKIYLEDWDFIMRCWGVCDLLVVSYYLIRGAVRGEIPSFSQMNQALRAGLSSDGIMAFVLTAFWALLYASMFISGILLFQRAKSVAIIAYLQTPFRIILAQPSLFFLLAALKGLDYFEGRSFLALLFGFVILIFSESLKLTSVAIWKRKKERKERIKVFVFSCAGRS
jgi:hypothetical protein